MFRARDQIVLARRIRNGEIAVMPKEPPPCYKVTLDIPRATEDAALSRRRRRREALGTLPDTKEEDAPLPSVLKSRVISDEGSLIYKEPLSAETIPNTSSSDIVAVNYLVLFPGAEKSISRGELPPLSIATALYNNPTSNEEEAKLKKKPVLESTLASFSLCEPSLHSCPLIVTFDGYTVATAFSQQRIKSGVVDDSIGSSYEEYKRRVAQILVSPLEGVEMRRERVTVRASAEDAADDDDNDADGRTEGCTEEGRAKRDRDACWLTITSGLRPDTSRKVIAAPPVRVTLIEVSGARLGQALCVREALRHVTTPFVMAGQHDWRFNVPEGGEVLPIGRIIEMMKTREDVAYVGFLSRRNLGYVKGCVGRGLPFAGLDRVDANGFMGIPLCKSFFWFDKNHIARTDHYRTFIFSKGRFSRGDFIEDTYGQDMIASIKEGGLDAWKEHRGVYLYHPDDGRIAAVVHVNGREYLGEEGRKRMEKRGRAMHAEKLGRGGENKGDERGDENDNDGALVDFF
ncbi:hypothetical protein HK101_011413 [Irineochytrium annulatum]|nr:hypothetical protein HK101_011413 [Irineochytrium annulatum]